MPLGDRRNSAFAGTLVTTGTGVGMVVATGDATQIGRIADMLDDVRAVDTPLIQRLTYFSKVITVVIVLFCGFVFLLGLLTGQSALQMLMAAVALAVSAIPEGLPAIMTIALAIGVKRMAARNAVIRKLPAVEALGSATVICTDKTGTLTRNEMTVTLVATVDGQFTVSGSGYAPTGGVTDGNGKATTLGRITCARRISQGGSAVQRSWPATPRRTVEDRRRSNRRVVAGTGCQGWARAGRARDGLAANGRDSV